MSVVHNNNYSMEMGFIHTITLQFINCFQYVTSLYVNQLCYEPCVQFCETYNVLIVDCKKYCTLKSDVKIV